MSYRRLPLDPKLGAGAPARLHQLLVDAAVVTREIQDAIALLAPLAGPTFTGTVTLPTPFTVGAVSVTSTGTELNLLDGVTATTAELNILDGVTSTAAELNLLDGVTATTADLNKTATIAAGEFTPTTSDEVNGAVTTIYPGQYVRVGDACTFSGKVLFNGTSAGQPTSVRITLPVITGSFQNGYDLSGSGTVFNSNYNSFGSCAVTGYVGESKAILQWVCANASVDELVTFTCTYNTTP